MNPSTQLVIASAPTQEGSELERLRAENQLLRQAIERMPYGICAFDGTDHLVLANARFNAIWNLPLEVTTPGATFADIIARSPGQETERSRAQPAPAPGSVGTRKREWQLSDGKIVEVTVARQADGSCVALHDDVTALRHAEQRIHYLARHDLLTGLPNRLVMQEHLARDLARVKRGDSLALLYVDLDHFKPVNDTFGHACGDALLQQVAQRMRDCVRDTDLLARIGGDEFTAVLTGAISPEGAAKLAHRIIERLSEAFEIETHIVHISASIGIAMAPGDGQDLDTLLNLADTALYRAKGQGRGRWCLVQEGSPPRA